MTAMAARRSAPGGARPPKAKPAPKTAPPKARTAVSARVPRPAGRLTITILSRAPAWRQALGDARGAVRRAARAAYAAAPREAAAEITIVLADDASLRALNRAFRAKDKPTNVLSFPAPAAPRVPGAAIPLGDVILAFETLAAEAAAAGKPMADHLSHLVVHGVLHLLGFDHETKGDAAVMEPLETRVLAGLGVPDPYGAGTP